MNRVPSFTPDELELKDKELFTKKYDRCVTQGQADKMDTPRGEMLRKDFATLEYTLNQLSENGYGLDTADSKAHELFRTLGKTVMRIWFFGKGRELFNEIQQVLQFERDNNMGNNGPAPMETVINAAKHESDEDNRSEDAKRIRPTGGAIYMHFGRPELIKVRDIFDLARIINKDETSILKYWSILSTQQININLTELVDGMLSYQGETLKVEDLPKAE